MSVHQIYPPIRFCITTYVTIIMILHLLSHVDMYPIQTMTSRKPGYGLECHFILFNLQVYFNLLASFNYHAVSGRIQPLTIHLPSVCCNRTAVSCFNQQ